MQVTETMRRMYMEAREECIAAMPDCMESYAEIPPIFDKISGMYQMIHAATEGRVPNDIALMQHELIGGLHKAYHAANPMKESKPRKQIIPCDLAIKRFYRAYVEVDEDAGTDQVIAAAKKMIVESSDPDAELCPDPDIYSEIESQDICWVHPDWDGAHYKDDDDDEEVEP